MKESTATLSTRTAWKQLVRTTALTSQRPLNAFITVHAVEYSAVLSATRHSYRKGQNLTRRKIKTPERIEIKFCTVDYVPKICPRTKFVDSCSSAGTIDVRANVFRGLRHL